MKLLLTVVLLTLIPVSANAITWSEFWEPFVYNENYHREHRYRYCVKRIRREQYIPGNKWRSGYVRIWYEDIKYPCNR